MNDVITYCSKCLTHLGLLKHSSVPAVGPRTHRVTGPQDCGGIVMIHKPLYVALFLEEASKRMLLEVVRPKHVTVYGEHMTLAFGRHMRANYPIGRTFSIRALSSHEDELGQCVRVDPGGIGPYLWEKQIPHITISCAEKVKPFYSMEMLEKDTPIKTHLGLGLWLNAVLDYHPRIKP